MKQNIKVLVKSVGKSPEVRVIPNTLEALQEIVGGYIETVTLPKGEVLVVNEEGLLEGLPFNFRIGHHTIVGNAFIAGTDEAEFASLSEERIKYWTEQFYMMEQFR